MKKLLVTCSLCCSVLLSAQSLAQQADSGSDDYYDLPIEVPYDLDCATNEADQDLASDMADHFLEGGRESTPELQSRLDVALQICVRRYSISTSEFSYYFLGNLGVLMTGEFERRIEEVGFDIDVMDDLIVLYLGDRSLNIPEYVDSRPDLFDEPMTRISETGVIEYRELEDLMRAYLNFSLDLIEAKAYLRAL